MENTATTPRPSAWQWDLVAGLLPMLALSPLLVYQVAALSTADHMRFFPIAIGVLIALVLWRLPKATFSRDPRRMWVATGLLALAALLYAYSVWVFSPWLGHLALLAVFTGWALGRLGNHHWAGVAGLACLLATTIPLPWGWDIGFAGWLQSSAAWCSAKALDALAIPCLQNGSLVETRDLLLVADEVCGGLASVYAYAAFAISLSLILHSSFVVGFKTLLLVPLWTLLGHFLTIFGILSVQEYLGRDLSSGWDFRFLEIGIAVLVLLLIWSSNRFLQRLSDPIPVADAEFGPVFSGLNKLLCWPQPDPFDDLEPDDEYEKLRFRKRKEAELARRNAQKDFLWSKNQATTWTVRIASVVFLVCAVLPLNSLAKQGLGQLNFGRPSFTRVQVEGLANQDALPDSLEEGWKKRGFQFVQRNPRSRQGEFSLIWRYSLEQRLFDASLDLPFLGWNDPASELETRGWKLEKSVIRWDDGWPWTESRLENELGGKAVMMHALLTRNGQAYTNIPSQLLDTVSLDSQSATSDQEPADLQQSATTVTYQFQLFSESGVELVESEVEGLRQQFLKLRTQVGELLP